MSIARTNRSRWVGRGGSLLAAVSLALAGGAAVTTGRSPWWRCGPESTPASTRAMATFETHRCARASPVADNELLRWTGINWGRPDRLGRKVLQVPPGGSRRCDRACRSRRCDRTCRCRRCDRPPRVIRELREFRALPVYPAGKWLGSFTTTWSPPLSVRSRVTSSCSPGKKVLGGGTELFPNNPVPQIVLISTRPANSLGTGWHAVYQNTSTSPLRKRSRSGFGRSAPPSRNFC